MFFINRSVYTSNVGRLLEQNSMPQVGKFALSVSNLGTLQEAKFPTNRPFWIRAAPAPLSCTELL